jgi:exodeoxyribonuclease VII small subunit
MARKKDADSNSADQSRSPILTGLTYEAALAELQSLVESIEGGEVTLDESLAAYRRGEMLLAHCRALLDKADQTVRTLSLGELERGGEATGGGDHDGDHDA